MNKFLAILKDSLRETLDVKLFYAVVILCLVTSLLVGSVRYKPRTMETKIQDITRLVNFVVAAQLRERRETSGVEVKFDITEFERTDSGDPNQPWTGNYRFVYEIHLKLLKEDGGFKEQDEKILADLRKEIDQKLMNELCKQWFPFLKNVQAKELPPSKDKNPRWEITSEGTTITSRKGWYHQISLFFGAVDVPPIPPPFSDKLGDIISFLGDKVIGTFGSLIIMILSIVMTASFLPNMLNKGTVDLLIVKPVNRVALFVFKFIGGLLFMFLTTAVIMIGIWLAIGIQSGMWVNSFLLCIFIYTFQFAIFYSVSAVVAVYTRSAIVAILASLGLWAVLLFMGWFHWAFVEFNREEREAKKDTSGWQIGVDIAKAVLPRYKDLDWLTSRMIQDELFEASQGRDELTKAQDERNAKEHQSEQDKTFRGYDWGSSILATSLFIILMLTLACWRFATKDY